MQGYLSLVLHAHLPFVRHPEHEKFLEEAWLFEAVTECYLPLLRVLEGWKRDGMTSRLTLSLSPTLCSMLLDPLLQERYSRHLEGLIELAEKETYRTHWDKDCQPLAVEYLEQFTTLRRLYVGYDRDLVGAFRKLQDDGLLEISTCAATHALLPLLEQNPASIRAQILIARDHYRRCFGRDPRGIWLPECAYSPIILPFLQEANIRWFIVETHGLLHAQPRPQYGVFAPVFTPSGVAAFGRDLDSAKQVWSKNEGYPGDPRYRDFYRDIGFDLDFDYVKPYLPSPESRGFTGIKYWTIGTAGREKKLYDRKQALAMAAEHADHFLERRLEQVTALAEFMDRPPILVCPYDAELFGHWWYEGPVFLDMLARKSCYDQDVLQLVTPHDYLRIHSTNQVAAPSPSSWGEEGFWGVWLNESNAWIYPHLSQAQDAMSALARSGPRDALQERALKQAGRELLLAQASDWPFIMRSGTSPDYARKRVEGHLLRFHALQERLSAGGGIDRDWLAGLEQSDNLFPDIRWDYWA